MILLNGSFGEGGGQIVRSALALSMVTGQPFQIDNIRGNRSKPGLLRQHLTAVRAAVEVCGGDVTGADLGSTSFTFKPGAIQGGDFSFAIGSAGSTTLVLQTILPALMTADTPSNIVISGGTHNTYAPSVHFLRRSFIPLIEKMGPTVHVELDRHGFYPAGGGQISVRIEPTRTLRPFDLTDRGKFVGRKAIATVADLDGSIAKRELDVVSNKLSWSENELQVEQLSRGSGPGNVLSMEIEHENVTEVFTGFGERNLSASKVANMTVSEVIKYQKSDVPVWGHLADQLLLPLALSRGGSFRTTALTPHALTNITVIETFVDIHFIQQKLLDESILVSYSPGSGRG